MNAKNFLLSLFGAILGIVIVKSLFLNLEEEIWIKAYTESIFGSKISSRVGGFYLNHSGFPVGLFIKIMFGGIAGAVLTSIAFLKISLANQNNGTHIETNNDGRKTKKCPSCAEIIMEQAKVCRFCNYKFEE